MYILEIKKYGKECTKRQGQYPVNFLTFKDMKFFESWKAMLKKIGGLLKTEYGRHRELLDSNKIAEYEKEYFIKFLNGNDNEINLSAALENLSRMLGAHYDKVLIIIINEYDTPIQERYSKDFYDEIIKVRRTFFLVYWHIDIYSEAVVNLGYNELNFTLASAVRNCQLTFAATVLRSTSHAANSSRSFAMFSILRDKHCLVITFSSISAMSSQLPCLGV